MRVRVLVPRCGRGAELRVLGGRAALAGAVLSLAASSAASADWPSYGHDLANSRDAGSSAPSPSEARRLKPRWTFTSHTGGLTGTPAVARGTVVIGSSDGTVYALNAWTGRLKWSYALHLRGYTYLTSSPAIGGDGVYVAAGSRVGPYLVDLSLADGRVRWRRNLDPYQPQSDAYASPVVWNGTVYMGVSGVAAEEGDPTQDIFGAVFAIDASSGARRWSVYTVSPGYDGGGVWSTAAVDPALGALFVGTGNSYRAPAAPTSDSIISMSTASGAFNGWFSAVRGDVFVDRKKHNGPDADFGASPNLVLGPDGRPLVVELTKSGVLWAVDRRTMALVWTAAVGTHPGDVHASLASTAYDGRRIYGMDDDGQQWAVDSSGHQVWTTPRDGRANFSPLAVGNGVVYSVNAAGVLRARAGGTGALLARIPLGTRSWGGVSIDGRTVFAATGTDRSKTGTLVALRP